MKIYVKNTSLGLVPLYDSDLEEKKKLKPGETYLVTVTKPRNTDFHKKYFALLNLGFTNTKTGIANFEQYRWWAIMKAGYHEQPTKGFFVPKSISFANMDNDEFSKLYQNTLQVVAHDVGASSDEVIEKICEFM